MPRTRHSPPSFAAYCSAIAFFDEHEPVDEAQFAAEEARSELNLQELQYLARELVRCGGDDGRRVGAKRRRPRSARPSSRSIVRRSPTLRSRASS
jgi:hypothetical protein